MKDKWKVAAVAALLIVLVACVIRDAWLLSRYHVAVGIDGYYYVLQIDALKNDHSLYFSTRTPLVLYFLTCISYLTNDSVAAVKIGSVLLHVLLSLGILSLILSTTHNHGLGILGSALAASSGRHLYMISEFINALGGLTFLAWAGWFSVRWARTRRPKWLVLAVLLLAAAALSHQLAIAVALIISVSVLIFLGLTSSRSHGIYTFVSVLAGIAIYFAPAVAKAQAAVDIPDRLRTELTAIPQWPISQGYLPETVMLAVLAPVALILLLGPMRIRAQSVEGSLFGLVAIWSLLVTLNPFLNESNGWTGIVGRIRGLAYIQVALILPGVIWLALSMRPRLIPYVLAALPPFVIFAVLAPLPLGLRREYLVRRTQLARQLTFYKGKVAPESLIIASHGDQFLVSSIIGITSQRLTPPIITHRSTYWLLDAPKDRLTNLESVFVVEHVASRTFLVEEQSLNSYLQSADDVDKRTLLIYNRHLMIAYNRGGPGNPFSSTK